LVENRVLRKEYVAREDEMAGWLRIILNEKLYDLYSTPNIWVIK
jgi:hypothetical protein